jgi:hypothetical protein
MTIGSKQEHLSRKRPPSRAPAGALVNEDRPAPSNGVSERDFGRLEEKAHQTEARVNRLEDEVYGRKRESRAFVVSWWQVVVAGLFVLAAQLGSILLMRFLGS